MENLEKAFLKARKGKLDKKEVFRFFSQSHDQLVFLQNAMIDGKIKFGPFLEFIIREPKERVITVCPFPQRVIQHAIFNVLHPVFDCHLSDAVFASRQGKGTRKAICRAAELSKQFTWFLKLDVRKYFESVPHNGLKSSLRDLPIEPEIMRVFIDLISSTGGERGMPIGNLASQYFANHYLSMADNWFENQQGFKSRYLRYMDDMVLFSDKKEDLKILSGLAKSWFSSILGLELKPPCLQPVSQGLPFLGFVLFREKTNWRKASKKRFKRKIFRIYQLERTGRISQHEFGVRARSLLDFAEPVSDKYAIKKSILLLERSSPNEG